MTVDIFEKETGKKVMSQTVIRSFTHYAEEKEFTSNEDFILPQDTVGFIYDTEGGKGVDGAEGIETTNLLEVRSVPCAWDYQPDTAGTTCIACPTPNWKQYRDGDCSLFTCPTGEKANAAGNGCEQIVCPSGQRLNAAGNECEKVPDTCEFWQSNRRYTVLDGGRYKTVVTCGTHAVRNGEHRYQNSINQGCEYFCLDKHHLIDKWWNQMKSKKPDIENCVDTGNYNDLWNCPFLK